MSPLFDFLNVWGERASQVAGPLLWQSSVLIGALFALDFLLRRRLRAAVRYACWMLVLLKLLLPPSFAFPTGLGWWIRSQPPAQVKQPIRPMVLSYGPVVSSQVPPMAINSPLPPVTLSWAALGLVMSASVSSGLFCLLIWRWRRVARDIREAAAAPAWLGGLLVEKPAGLRLRLTEQPFSPAVCGLMRPVILLPRAMPERLAPAQLRAVLLHELIHLRRGDVWVNCAQALLQVVFWWHPLLWLANARIRALREEAVDDAVMLALRHEADGYAPTLLEVARLALQRPTATLGLVGILESRTGLRRRIERLLDFHPPRRAGLTLASVLSVAALAAVALPMGEAPIQEPELPWTQFSPSPATLLQDGKLLYERGKLEEAEKKLKQLSPDAPQYPAAEYYLKLIEFGRRIKGSDKGAVPPRMNAHLEGTLISTSPGRKQIMRKLDQIRLDTVEYDDLPLTEVIHNLHEETIKRDPEHKGINFIINPQAGPVAETIDPSTGLLVPLTASPVDVGGVTIRINPPLSDLRMIDLLDAIVKVASKRIRYSIEDYAIVFSMTDPFREPPLYTRVFKVDPNTFRQGLEGVTGIDFGALAQSSGSAGGTAGGASQGGQGGVPVIPRVSVAGRGPSGQNGGGQGSQGGGGLTGVTRPTAMQDFPFAIRDYFLALGVNLSPGSGRTLYGKPDGTFLVHATRPELDTIEKAIQLVNATSNQPPVINRQGAQREPNENLNSPTEPAKLYTRIFRIDPNRFRNNLERVTGLSFADLAAAAGAGTNGIQPADAPARTNSAFNIILRRYFADIGVNLSSPKNLYYNDLEGSLLLHATIQDMAAIEDALAPLINLPQVHLKGTFLKLSPGEAFAFWEPRLHARPGHRTTALSAAETTRQLALWKEAPGVEIVSSFSIQTLSGRQAVAGVTEPRSVTDFGPSKGAPRTNTVDVGSALDVIASVKPDWFQLDVTLTPSLTDADVIINKITGLPGLHKRYFTSSQSMWDGETIALDFPEDPDAKSAEMEQPDLVVLVTATLLDPAGNRLHTDEQIEQARRSKGQNRLGPNFDSPPKSGF